MNGSTDLVCIEIEKASGKVDKIDFQGTAQWIRDKIGEQGKLGTINGIYNTGSGALTFAITYDEDSGEPYDLVYQSSDTSLHKIRGLWGNAEEGTKSKIGRKRGRFEMIRDGG
jgi:hypothetical protein